MANAKLSEAKNAKNDEFYTQYEDIQREINAYLEYNPNVFKGKTVLLRRHMPRLPRHMILIMTVLSSLTTSIGTTVSSESFPQE